MNLASLAPPRATEDDIYSSASHHKKLGIRMREIRKKRGLTQLRVARMTGVAKQTVSNWERAESPPGIDNLQKFCQALRVSMVQIWGNSSPDLKPMPDYLGRLGPASRILPVLPTVIAAGNALMHGTMTKTDRSIATIGEHPKDAIAFLVDNDANEPRFGRGDVVTLIKQHMAPRGSMVLAYVADLERYVFRRFLPRTDGEVDGAVLRALNDSFPDIEMSKKDAILARMGEHTSTRH